MSGFGGRTGLKRIVRDLVRPDLIAFVHVPKTGGSYLAAEDRPLDRLHAMHHVYVVEDEGALNPIYVGHDERMSRYVVRRSELGRYLVMSNVRDIFSWLVSYAGHAAGWNPRYRNPDHYDYEHAQRGFDYLVRTIAEREDIWPCRRFIHTQLFTDRGSVVPDWINRTETLDDDLQALAMEVGVGYRRRPEKRKRPEQDYRTFYDDDLVRLVRETWGRELDLFGYDFEGFAGSPRAFHGRVGEAERGVRYLWSEDRLSRVAR